MRTNKILGFLALIVLSVVLVFSACKKDDDDKSSENLLEKSYFTVENGVYKNGDFPAQSGSQSAPEIESVYGNTSVLEGGSNPISIKTTSSVKELMVGVEGVKGYYSIPSSNLKSADEVYLVILLLSQEFEKDSFVILLAIQNDQNLVSARQTITVTRIEAGTGKLQISCAWDQPNDIDLHLVEPNGQEIYYGNDISNNFGFLDVDSNAGCSIDNINNENITYGDTAIVENGNYIVRVDLYSNCDLQANTNVVVTARYNGRLITPSTGTNPYSGVFTEADEDYGDEGSGREIMKFAIGTTKDSGATETRIRFDYPKKEAVTKSTKGQK
ncbi:MAG: hypothetical protein EOM83_07695 [Clostridia bacterium]|nr:hypothetical protein [Clostridia bacterium]